MDEAYEALPPGPWQVKVRSDSAAYEQEVLDHWRDRGWEFVVSADMTPQLRAEIEKLPGDAWQIWKTERGGVVREWAEVPYVPSRREEKRDTQPYRYLAIRLREQQGELFGDGRAVRHFAVVTNRWDMEGQALYQHRMKVDESFRDLKSLLGLGEVMNKSQEYLEKVIALVLLAYGLGLLLGEEIRDRVYAGKRRWRLFSGLFVLLKQLRQVSAEIIRASVRQTTLLLKGLLLPPPVPTHV